MAVEAFEIETALGPVTLPSLAMVPAALLKKVITYPERERGWVLIEELSSPAALHVLDQLPADNLADVMKSWGDASGVEVGDLIRLAFILRRHSEALEADLIAAGLRLRHCPSEDFNWHDLKVFIAHMPRTANLVGAMYPDQFGWTKEAMLLADIEDYLAILAWQPTKDGRKNKNRPAQVLRPGVTPADRNVINADPTPLSDMKKRLSHIHKPTTQRDRSKRIRDLWKEAMTHG